MDRVPTDEQIQKLRHGVMITTPVQRDSGTKLITAITLPCNVTRLPSSMHDANHSKKVKFVLVEGRNRQIRRMAEAVGLHVVNLHRTTFAGITTKGLTEGDWIELNKNEMAIIKKSLERSSTAENLEFGNDDEQ